MLWELDIENIAVIQKAHINFTHGFNVFTGETGAGKSILLGAIGAVLGDRVSKEIIRTGETKAKVSAFFGSISTDSMELLNSMGFEAEDNELIISREISADRSLCYINGKISTAAMLKSIGKTLINIHGQHDNGMLADTDCQRNFVDSFGNLAELLKEYSDVYSKYHTLFKHLEELTLDENEKNSKLEKYKYEINEILTSALKIGEEEELISRKNIIKNSKNLFISLSAAKVILIGDDETEGVVSKLQEAAIYAADCCEYIAEMTDICKKITDYRYELDEMAETVRKYLESLSFDENELEDIEERLDLIFRLKKKYGNSIEEIIKYSERIEEEYLKLSDNENTIKEINEELIKLQGETRNLAEKLTVARKKAAIGFSDTVEAELKTLDMPHVKFIVDIRPANMSKTGADDLEFLISTNAGEEPRPLSKVASGGEMSRIMLAIKNVISANDDISTLIFDEIDSGISGNAAQKVGKKLLEVSNGRQVICVTHLAQVAAFANTHLLILKKTIGERTFTEIESLDIKGRARELARIISGEPITDLAIANATELLEMSGGALKN